MAKKVYLGLSGGVDSSVAAWLLKQQGFEVIGVFIKVWEPSSADRRFPCLWREDRRDAMRVAAALDIPFITLDLSAEYKQMVVDYMVEEYRAGRTPNPDVMCNKAIKFGAFYDRARQSGADLVATGHYARIEKGQLKMGFDPNKDQSYFLWNLTAEQLKHIVFPIGDYLKSEVRILAAKAKLVTAEKKDSQGLCFIGKLDLMKFLKDYIRPQAGEVLDRADRVIGRHDGATFYTLGQRHGFIITDKSDTDRPYYVSAKDIKKNTITVVNDLKSATRDNRQVGLTKVNWINGEPQSDKSYQARLRYRQPLQSCRIKQVNGKWQVVFDIGQEVLPAGQSLVVYDGEVCLGGGVID